MPVPFLRVSSQSLSATHDNARKTAAVLNLGQFLLIGFIRRPISLAVSVFGALDRQEGDARRRKFDPAGVDVLTLQRWKFIIGA